MNDSRRPYDAQQPEPIDDNEDRLGSIHELDFDDDEPGAKIGDERSESEHEQLLPRRRLRSASTADDESTDDDMSPETLIHEDGARDAHEAGEDVQADWDLSIVGEEDIGAGTGLDEAEMARQYPLDRKR
jgi:hypothetical protein